MSSSVVAHFHAVVVNRIGFRRSAAKRSTPPMRLDLGMPQPVPSLAVVWLPQRSLSCQAGLFIDSRNRFTCWSVGVSGHQSGAPITPLLLLIWLHDACRGDSVRESWPAHILRSSFHLQQQVILGFSPLHDSRTRFRRRTAGIIPATPGKHIPPSRSESEHTATRPCRATSSRSRSNAGRINVVRCSIINKRQLFLQLVSILDNPFRKAAIWLSIVPLCLLFTGHRA